MQLEAKSQERIKAVLTSHEWTDHNLKKKKEWTDQGQITDATTIR